jgi:hypothetical protein
MANRSESIPQAHQQTFEWMFSAQHETPQIISSKSFSAWLQRENSSLYWTTGKPGSGKSTLMKFLYNHQNLNSLLSDWAGRLGGGHNITKAGFYFWNSGSTMQMSRLGLFRTLLHSCLEGNTDLSPVAFPERWKQFAAFGGGQDPWDWLELKRAFEIVISDQSRPFFFLIDGLDEFDGEPREIIKLVLMAIRPNVKICVASRPWPPFEDAFKDRPNLLLEDLTWRDISTYIAGCFHDNEHYIRLQLDKPVEATALVQSIVGKASGVFLWVYLVVESLLEGLSNSDRLYDLHARLDALPADLEALFDNLLRRLGPVYFKQACEIFYLLRTHRQTGSIESSNEHSLEAPSLLAMYFADDEDLSSSLAAPWVPLETADALRKAEHMRRRLIARCKGMLETSNTGSNRPVYDHEIIYLHRTARDYIESEDYWPIVLQTAGQHAFKPGQRWANANLWLYKVHPIAAQLGEWISYKENFTTERAQDMLRFLEKTHELRTLYFNGLLFENPNRGGTETTRWTVHLFRSVPTLREDYLKQYVDSIRTPTEREGIYKLIMEFSLEHALLNFEETTAPEEATTPEETTAPLHQQERHGILKLTGYYKAPRVVHRLRQRPVD